MTPIENVFMLSIDAKLDYETLRKICLTGHSRIPVYEEVEVSVSPLAAGIHVGMDEGLASRLSLDGRKPRTQKVKKIIGILLVKQCVLLDPNGTPLTPSARAPSDDNADRRHARAQNPAEPSAVRAQQRAAAGHPRQVPGRALAHGDRLALLGRARRKCEEGCETRPYAAPPRPRHAWGQRIEFELE